MTAKKSKASVAVTVLWCGLLVGTLDILAAFANAYLSFDKGPIFVLKYIATSLFGVSAFNGGTEMVVCGLLIHYAIAYFFTALFIVLYPRLGGASQNNILIGVLYGIGIWLLMNLIVVPLTKTPAGHIHAKQVIINCLILIVMIGVPLSIFTSNFYSAKKR
ncbi:hypothetical protein BEL04_10515 [Mucilaginibacter sp. PPCGB 2223]|uniref:hypothetical protein n=1 Tax=Mucilaginibacter sp. PPCGB 2223 TaxID=1886027 RepID=UPI0008246F4D|nr:hypothetical protein [Mucilaginibacter sp. PPCGB 2223]OCX54650.1 hypothetical protein BEL04_10515 [Mucilaginibacter sp. PPCGB 2223]